MSRPARDIGVGDKETHDLVIRGGTVVIGDHTETADLAIDDGVISRIGGHPIGTRVLDASGLLVAPGGIDLHVHFTPLPNSDAQRRPDDFASGSRAALMGGVTTIGNMTHQHPGEGLFDALERGRTEAERDSLVDFILHPVLNDPNPTALSDIHQLHRRGYPSLKLFMVFDEFDSLIDKYVEAMARAAANQVLVLMHCEDRSIIRFLKDRLTAEHRLSIQNYPESRPVTAEVIAVDRAIALAEITGARVLIVHLASSEALDHCMQARARGVDVSVETRPLYLHIAGDVFGHEDAAKYVGNPPPRDRQNQQELWDGLISGAIDTLASDHAPWTLEQKMESGADLRTALPGVAEIETMLPMLFSEGVVKGRMSIGRFVEVTSSVPARLMGLAGIKGELRVGSDADLVAWDPEMTWVIDGSAMESRAAYSPYDGWTVQGSPAYVMSRGVLVRDPDGLIDATPGRGRMATLPTRA